MQVITNEKQPQLVRCNSDGRRGMSDASVHLFFPGLAQVMTKAQFPEDFEKRRTTAVRLHNLAAKYHTEGDAVRPEKLYLQALELNQTLLGADHPEVALTLNNLALHYKALGRIAEAQPLYERALSIFQKAHGASHANTAANMFNLARLLNSQGRELHQPASPADKVD